MTLRSRLADLLRMALLASLTAGALVAGAPATEALAPTCDGLPATIVALPGTETVGTSGDDVIVGTDGGDVVDGGGGNDRICGGPGSDLLRGGAGDDRIFGEADGLQEQEAVFLLVGDSVAPGPGDDYVDLGYDARWADPNVRQGYSDGLYYGSSASIAADLTPVAGFGTVTGEGTDTVASAPELPGYLLFASSGADSITGSPGPDTIYGDEGDDVIDGAAGDDVLFDNGGGPRADDDVVRGGSGDDTITWRYGLDEIFGGPGDDLMRDATPRGASRVFGGPGDDGVQLQNLVGRGQRVARGGAGIDGLTLVPGELREGARLLIDVPRHAVRAPGVRRSLTRVAAFETYGVATSRLRLRFIGSAADERVDARGVTRLRATMRGGADFARGSRGDDQIDGGTGDDVIRGFHGTDTCLRAEHTVSCEVT